MVFLFSYYPARSFQLYPFERFVFAYHNMTKVSQLHYFDSPKMNMHWCYALTKIIHQCVSTLEKHSKRANLCLFFQGIHQMAALYSANIFPVWQWQKSYNSILDPDAELNHQKNVITFPEKFKVKSTHNFLCDSAEK